MENDFDNVSWQNEPEGDNSRPNTSQSDYKPGSSAKRKAGSGSAQAGHQADNVDLAGIGGGSLDCKVDTPLKENDGTKDAYVSYLVTTHVCLRSSSISLRRTFDRKRLTGVCSRRQISHPFKNRM